MQALLFLTTRSFSNAVKRSVTSGRRLVTLIFAIAYYGYLMFRPRPDSRFSTLSYMSHHRLTTAQVDVWLFGFFGVLSFLLTMTLLAPRGGFRQADVDVLFATPVNPRLVLFQRVWRDYLITLFTPLLLCLFGGSSSITLVQAFLIGSSKNSELVGRAAIGAWILMALAWVCFANAIGAMIDRSDLEADRNKKILNRIVLFSILGLGMYFLLVYRQNPSLDTAVAWAQTPPVRIVFFTATAATWMVKGAMYGDYGTLAIGAAVLLTCIGLGIWVMLSQLSFMYDQAAVRGFGTAELRQLRRNNDFYGIMANEARRGKLKVGRFSRWLGSLRLKGGYALLWKDVLLQLRGARYLYALFGPMQLFMVVAPVVMINGLGRARGDTLMYMQVAGVMIIGINSAISGFIELLKRVDFQKPLPFRPAGTVFWEVAAKCIPAVLFGTLGALIDAALVPSIAWYALASILVVIGSALVISATVFLVTIAFPDAGDASQRTFRAILILIGSIIFGSPGTIVLVVMLSVLKVHPMLAALPCTAIDLGLSIAVCYFSGQLYEGYNPSE